MISKDKKFGKKKVDEKKVKVKKDEMKKYAEATDKNIALVRSVILQKKNIDVPFHSTMSDVSQTFTDYDNFPYNRWYRGVPDVDAPIVAEREAGWRPRNDECYTSKLVGEDNYPTHCYQVPCSTVFPCYPTHQTKYSDKLALKVAINKACIPQYR